MLALLGSLAGFLTSFIPEIFSFIKDKKDKVHELELIKLQIEAGKNSDLSKLEEVRISSGAIEARAIYHHAKPSGIKWVDAMSAFVRPFITYSFFLLYIYLKIVSFLEIGSIAVIWTEEDQGLFSAIVGFWFGQRAFGKSRINGGGNGH